MRWRDAVGLAATGLRRRPGRAVLTVLAVALAAALLSALVTIAGTARTRVLDQLARGGPLAGIRVAAAEPDPDEVDNDNARPGPARDLDDDVVRRIRQLPDVAAVIPLVSSRVLVVPPIPSANPKVLARLRAEAPAASTTVTTVEPGPAPPARRQPFGDTLVGVDLARASQLPITVLAGRLPDPASTTELAVTQGYLERLKLERREAPAVLGTELELAAPRAIGRGGDRRVRGRWMRAEIVGVVAQEAGSGQILAPLAVASTARAWTGAGGDLGAEFRQPTSPYSGLFVVARGLERVSGVRAQITDIGYSTSAPENLIASVQRYLRVVEIVLTAIGGIALVIAALGIANAMLAAVRERKREIGVLKAIGARDRDVRRVFLVEAGTLGLVGGLTGTAAGWALAEGVGSVVNRYLTSEGLAGVRLALPFSVLAASIVGSAVLAVLAGTMPAVRAARLPARDAIGAA